MRRSATAGAAAVVVLFAVALFVTRPPSPRGSALEPASHVVLVGVPGLTFADLRSGPMPALRAAAGRGGVAAMTARLATKSPTTGDLYASIGAGSEAATPAGFGATAPAGDGAVTVSGATDARARNRRAHRSSLPGALGDALARRTVGAVAIGNADKPGPNATARDNWRPVTAAVMDRDGRVGAVVDRDRLVVDDRVAPSGFRSDPDAVSREVQRALTSAGMVVVDTGDMDRVDGLLPPPTLAVRTAERNAALARVDAVIAAVLRDSPPRTLLLVAGLDPGPHRQLTPLVATGPGVRPGSLVSPSTGRRGVVTLADLAPTVLRALAVPVPTGMVGRPLRSAGGTADLAGLARLDRDARASERLRGPITDGLVALVLVFTAFALLTLSGLGRPARSGRALGWLGLAVSAAPLAATAVGLLPAGWLGSWSGLVLAVLAVLVAVVARSLTRRPLDAFLAIEAATLVVVLVDLCTGSRLQLSSALGSSLLVAARFRGLGNAGLGVVGAATVLLAAGWIEGHGRRGIGPVVALFAVVVAVVCLPSLGAKVGGVFVLVPVLAGVAIALAGRRISWRVVLLCGAAGAAVLAVAVAVDAARPADTRSHLGRLLGSSGDGGTSLGTVIARKLSSAVHVTRTSHWMPAALALAVLIGLVVWRFDGGRSTVPAGSAARTGLIGVVAVAALGLATNDSGILTAALALVAGAVFVVLRRLETAAPP